MTGSQHDAGAAASIADLNAAPLIAHVVHGLNVGGLENGLVNLINHSDERYRHAIVCLTRATDFRQRIEDPSVPVIELHKQRGQDWGLYRRVWKVMRELRPAILHTRNFGALDSLFPARAAGVRRHVHGLHGWDVNDLRGTNRRYALMRRIADPFTQRYIAVSRDLADWLTERIGVSPAKVAQIYNGVDTSRFHPARQRTRHGFPADFAMPGRFVFGWVGRMDAVKDPLALLRAFHAAVIERPELRDRLRLAMIGAGQLSEDVHSFVSGRNLESLVWLPGARNDVPELMRELDVFVLPSLNEGISNTILESMASGVPVIATRVGGNSELITEGHNGTLVPSSDLVAMSRAILSYATDPGKAQSQGAAARAWVEARFSMDSMVRGYLEVYDALLEREHRPALVL